MHILFALLLTGCVSDPEPFANAYVIDDLSQAIGGVKALAQPGDLLIENDHMRVVILGERYSMGPGLFGGSLIDADLQRYDPAYSQGKGNDLFSEMFATANLYVQAIQPPDADPIEDWFVPGTVEVIADGSDGEAAIIRATGSAYTFLTILYGIMGYMGMPDFHIVTDYILEPGEPWMLMRTTVTMGADEEPAAQGQPLPLATVDMPILDYIMETGLALGDFYLAGGSVKTFTPGLGRDESGAVLDATEAGRSLFTEPFTPDFLANTGDGTSYALAMLDGVMLVPMFSSNLTGALGAGIDGAADGDRFQSGETFSYERIFTVGDGDVGSVLDNILQARGTPVGTVEGWVEEKGTREPLSHVDVFAFEGQSTSMDDIYNLWITDVGLRESKFDGSFVGNLPVGTWTLLPHATGRPSGDPVVIEVKEGKTLSVRLELPMTGNVEVTVVDEVGRELPAKISFLSTTGVSMRNFDLGDSYISGGVSEVAYTPGGPVSVTLAPGEYYAVASRGHEYELGVSEPFVVTDHEPVRMELQVVHSVDTSGWISADFHVHGEMSVDAGTPLERRVLSMAAEGVEFFNSSDHDILTEYAPVVEALGLEEWVHTEVGVESSTMELGHYVGFPLRMDHLADAQGAFDWTELSGRDIFDALRDLRRPGEVEPITISAHPRAGILGYFDEYGLSHYRDDGNGDVLLTGSLMAMANPYGDVGEFTLDFDAMEIFNEKRFDFLRTPTQSEIDAYYAGEDITAYDIITRTMDEQQALIDGTDTFSATVKGALEDWFNLNNLGYRITAVGNSDTHDPLTVESGCPRNFLMVEGDSATGIDVEQVAEAIRAHRVVASHGPFIRFEADGQPVGSEVTTTGSVDLFIEVQAPMWMDIDHVELIENGTLIQEWAVPATQEVVAFSETVTVQPDKDSWYAVVAAGDNDLSPVYTPVERPSIQISDIVGGALGDVEGLPIDVSSLASPVTAPRIFPMMPFAVTNAIWVDVGADGWDPPGFAEWIVEP